MPDSTQGRSDVPLCLAAALVLVAVWWGGGTSQWTQSVLIGGIGLLLVFAPASRWPTRGIASVTSAWILLALAAFLPARVFATSAWREAVAPLGLVSGATLAPQP